MMSQTPQNCNLVQLSMSMAQTDKHVAKSDQLKNNWWLMGTNKSKFIGFYGWNNKVG